MNVEQQAKQKMNQALEHFRQELRNIRTGRANPGMLDSVHVEVYGTSMRLKDVATVNVPESRQLLVAPFDPQNAGSIAKSIEKANLGFKCSVEGGQIRIFIPQMDEAMRKEMVKMARRLLEECKISVRNIRRESNELLRKLKADGKIAEDEEKRGEKHVQELTDSHCAQADTITAEKEKEVMQI